MNAAPTVYVVDDDLTIRNGLRQIMESPSLAVQLYESGEHFLDAGNLLLPGCMVVDLKLPGISGIDLLQHLRAADNHIPAIILSGYADLPTAICGMKLGVIDLLQKPIERTKLLDAVNRAITFSTNLFLHDEERETARNRLARLTPREREMLRLIVSGRSNKQMAIDLNIAFRTVINHRSHLMAKTQATNAADLTRLSMIAGVLTTN